MTIRTLLARSSHTTAKDCYLGNFTNGFHFGIPKYRHCIAGVTLSQ